MVFLLLGGLLGLFCCVKLFVCLLLVGLTLLFDYVLLAALGLWVGVSFCLLH